MPATNKKYWAQKISRNKLRDSRTRRKLRGLGWKVIEIWEHELREGRPAYLKKIRSGLKAGNK